MRCSRLVPIVGRGRATPLVRVRNGLGELVRFSDRQLAYFPVFHDDEDGQPCEGAEVEIR